MGGNPPQPELVGREDELDRVREWLGLLAGGAAALLITGEAGIGKTSVWAAAVASAREAELCVLIARPAESELPLGYAALGDLLAPLSEEASAGLPEPQASALSAALSLGPQPDARDPVLVARATLGALRTLAVSRPIVVAIDDTQWLDAPSARALAFAVRRLEEARIGIVATLREGHDDPLALASAFRDRHVDVSLRGLTLGATGRLLRSRVNADLPRQAVVLVQERSAGNPFFALQLAQAGDGPLPASLADLVGRRLDAVPTEAMAAVERVAVRGPLLVTNVADEEAIDRAVAAGVLIEDGATVRFAHPLLAAAAYSRIPPGRRRSLHREAAAAGESVEDRARHLALATRYPDRATAELLDQAARSARSRGASESAAELTSQAIRLTPTDDADDRDRRQMDQADYLALTANERAARAIVDDLLLRGVRGTTRVRALVQRALTETTPEAAVAGLEAAVAEPHPDRRLAARTLAQLAWQRGAWLGDVGPALDEAMAALALADELGDPSTQVAALTTAGLMTSISGKAGAAELFRRALEITDEDPRAASDHTPRLAYAHERWWRGDFATAEQLIADERRLAQDQGDDGMLMRLSAFGGELAEYQGRWDEAAARYEDALVDARDYWRGFVLTHRAILRARRGDAAGRIDAAEVLESPTGHSDKVLAAAAGFAIGLLDFAEGRIAEAARHAIGLVEATEHGGARAAEFAVFGPEMVAILAEASMLDDAAAIADRLERRRVQFEPWVDGALDLCRGYIALGAGNPADAAVRLKRAAERCDDLGSPWEHGQARLGLGIALRRLGRRNEAAEVLEQAVRLFEALRAEPALRRARDELRRARPRPRRDDRLTAAESRVATLVIEGRTNREVAASLFTTVATVEAHLTRIYSKLGVRSRSELTRRVMDGSVELERHLAGET
jgi:DNA-binding CsgD family transcriptional regulator